MALKVAPMNLGTGTPEIGGLGTRTVLAIYHGLQGLNICGGDMVEISPQYCGACRRQAARATA